MSFTAGDGSGEARLLVVEDEQTILELLAGSLRFVLAQKLQGVVRIIPWSFVVCRMDAD